MVLGLGDLLGLAGGMLFVGGRRNAQVFGGRNAQVTLGVDAAGNGAEVTPCRYLEVTACLHAGTVLRHGFGAQAAAQIQAIALLNGIDVHIAASDQCGVTSALQYATGIGDVTTCIHRQVISCLDA